MVYDEQRQRVLLTGGSTPTDGGNRFIFFNDAWAWDGTRWTALGASGPMLSGQAVAFHGGTRRVVALGGFDGRMHGLHRELRDAWTTLDQRDELVMAEGGAVYDARRDRLVVFGGSAARNAAFGVTREHDGSTWRTAATDGPPPRQAHAMVYDSKRGRTVVFGGLGAAPAGERPPRFGDTWEWDGARWERRDVSGPSPRFAAGAAYDSRRGLTIVFGGLDSTGMRNDTWGWDGVTWRLLAETGPSARAMGYMAYDRGRDRVVLFGGRTGYPDGDMDDTWEWDGSAWTRIIPPAREVSVTFDDLPVVSVTDRSVATAQAVTRDILAALARHRVPATGFVNEQKLETSGALDSARLALLHDWIKGGHELGNHTYSHPDLHRVPLASFQADLLRGQRHSRALATRSGAPYRYFRHPFLHTGRSSAVQEQMRTFLATHGYAVAPVTIDNYDYTFSAAYERTLASGDSAEARRIRESYIAYMDTIVGFYERQSMLILGRMPPQVLLLHANPLNAVALDDLAAMLKRRGYAFVSLEQALKDPAYGSEDSYVGPAGITWLHRWALTAGLPSATFRGEPDVPDWVRERSRAP